MECWLILKMLLLNCSKLILFGKIKAGKLKFIYRIGTSYTSNSIIFNNNVTHHQRRIFSTRTYEFHFTHTQRRVWNFYSSDIGFIVASRLTIWIVRLSSMPRSHSWTKLIPLWQAICKEGFKLTWSINIL